MAGGFKFQNNRNSSKLSGAIRSYNVSSDHATNLAINDFVKVVSKTDGKGLQSVDAGTNSGNLLGAIVGFLPRFVNLNLTYLPAGTAGTAYIMDDPQAEYAVQVTGGTIAEGDIGKNINLDPTAATPGPTDSGYAISNMAVAYGSLTTSPAQFTITGIVEGILVAPTYSNPTPAQYVYVRLFQSSNQTTVA